MGLKWSSVAEWVAITNLASLVVCSTQPTELYIDLVDFSEEDFAALNASLGPSNAITAKLSSNPFSIQTLNSSMHEDIYRHATWLNQRNTVAFVEGSHRSARACVLAIMTGVPLVRLSNRDDHCHRRENVLSLSATYLSQARATLQLLEMFHWTNVVLVYEGTRVHEITYFRTLVDPEKTNVITLPFSRKDGETVDGAVARVMRELFRLRAHVILLYADSPSQQKLLSYEHCLASQEFVWIIQGEVPRHIKANRASLVIGFQLPLTPNAAKKMGVTENLTDVSPIKESQILSFDSVQVLAHALAAISNQKAWAQLFGGFQPSRDVLIRHIRESRYEGMSGNIQFEPSGLRKAAQLDVLNLANNSFVKIGSWTPGEGIVTRNLRRNQMPDDHLRLEGKTLRVAVMEDRPFLMSQFNPRKNATEYFGYCIDILNKLADEMKFNYEIYHSPDGAYGAEVNGTWNGLIGELVRKKADMALSALTTTRSREKVVDFTVPFMYYTTKMIMKKNVVVDPDYLQFMLPFSTPVWIMVIACLIAVTASLYVLNYYCPYGYKNEEGKGTSSEFNLSNSLWFSLACMLQQGGDNTPKSISARVLVGFYWFCILIWISTYTANLAAFFTVKNVHHPIRNLEDALDSYHDLGPVESGFTHSFFDSSGFGLYQEASRKIHEHELPRNSEEGIAWARQKDFIFISDGPILDYEAQKKPCDLIVVPCLDMELGLAIAMQDSDPLVETVSLNILRWRQKGYIDALEKKWWDAANQCHVQKPTGVRIDVRSMAGVYIVLLFGLVMSCFTMAAERIWHRRTSGGSCEQPDASRVQPDAAKPIGDPAVSSQEQQGPGVH